MDEALTDLMMQVQAAAAGRTPLRIRAGGTKDFYGNTPQGDLLDPRGWSGIESYEPSELVITARCGTPLTQIEAALTGQGQMLAFEPPHFGDKATIGGCIAAGLAGPRRVSAGYTNGSVRDYVLGVRLLDGRARLLRFGGTVIKNVAGYDVSRVLAGSLGILGLIVDVSLKVLPQPAAEITLAFAMDETTALERFNYWAGKPLPVSASCWREGQLWLRLSGSHAAVTAARTSLGGELLDADQSVVSWMKLREQVDPWFSPGQPLWRIALPSTAQSLALAGRQCIEWSGALRWLYSDLSPVAIRGRAMALGGHATLFRGGERSGGVFTPLAAGTLAIHQRLKDEFDPSRIFNRGRMYAEL